MLAGGTDFFPALGTGPVTGAVIDVSRIGELRGIDLASTEACQLLAQNGIVIWICDNRSASGKGIEATSAVYRRFGDSELRDIEDGLTWLKQQP